MSILNRPSDGLLTVLLATRRALIAYGPQPEDRLLSLAAPPSVVDGKPEMARKTLTRWTQLGVFEERDGRIHLNHRVAPDTVAADDLDGLRKALLSIVMMAHNNPALARQTDRASLITDDRSLASDFTCAVAWMLTQDVYASDGRWESIERLQTHQGIDPRPFANQTRWNGFVEWGAFLGLGWRTLQSGLVLDPAFAVASVLDGIFNGHRELPQEIFLEKLATLLPVLDGGAYRLAVEAQIARPWLSLRQNQISPSLSTALLHLEAAHKLRLENRADAPQWALLGRLGRELRTISHVVLARDG